MQLKHKLPLLKSQSHSSKHPKNQLSLSFYHTSTLRQHKQIIFDLPLDFAASLPPKAHSLGQKTLQSCSPLLKQS